MSRITLVTVLLVSLVLLTAGNKKETLKDDSRFRVDPVIEAAIVNVGVGTAPTEEVDLVEGMALNRSAYRVSLESLIKYYKSTGNSTKRLWAENELKSFESMRQYRYLMPAEAAYANLSATDSIEEADKLYEEALKIDRDARGLILITDDNKLRIALKKYNLLIAMYPTSDKIDSAAYRAGRIYEHFKDYEIAVVYFQRAFQWSDTTPHPARFKAAYILDRRLHKRDEALPLYKMVLKKEKRFSSNIEFAEKRIKRLARPMKKMKAEEPE